MHADPPRALVLCAHKTWHTPFEQGRALSCAVLLQQDWAQEGDDEEEGSSSDGRGSSYFSGERLEQTLSSTASPMHSQQSLTGHVDRASLVCSLRSMHRPCLPLHSVGSAVELVVRAGPMESL